MTRFQRVSDKAYLTGSRPHSRMSLSSVGCTTAFLVLVIQSVSGQEAPFTRITVGAVVNDGGDSTGVSWVDYDQDGYLDLFVSNFGTPRNFLYHNNGDGTFARVDSAPITTDIMNAEGCVWADFDKDGDLDLFVSVGLGANDVLYRNDGGGVFTRLTHIPPVESGGSSRGCAWADYDNDGWVDLFVANESNQKNFLFHNDGGNGFTRAHQIFSSVWRASRGSRSASMSRARL